MKKEQAMARIAATKAIQLQEMSCVDLSVREGGMTISVLNKIGRYMDKTHVQSHCRSGLERASIYKRVNRFSNLAYQKRYALNN